MSMIYIGGAGLGDTIFTTDAEIFGVEITWSITRIQRDAAAGVFGPPQAIPMKLLPPMTDANNANIDANKVRGMIEAHLWGNDPSPINTPVLQVLVNLPAGLHRVPIDGNHRIEARRKMGLQHFDSYVVPEELERQYRVTEEIIHV